MAEHLAEGKEFKSFSALQDAVHTYEQSCFAQLSRTDSRTIENEEQRRNSKHFNPAIKYSFVTFTCAFGGKPYVSRSTGIRNSKPRIKCNCPVILKCFATSDGQKLVVRHSQLDCHNHETSEESFKALPRGRLLDEETELEIFNLIEMHENKKLARKLVKEKLIEETGRDISYKDIQNIEKRMSRKREKERNGEEYDENEELDDEYEEEKGSDQEDENGCVDEKGDADETKKEDKTEANGTADDKPDEGSATENDKKESSPAQSPAKSKPKPSQSTVKKNPKTPARKIKEESSRPSTARPRRSIREPRRFRDTADDLSPPVKKRRTSESGDEETWEDSADSQGSNLKEVSPPPKTKKPGAKRGRKPLRRPAQEPEGSEEESEGESRPVKKQVPANKVKVEKSSKPEDGPTAKPDRMIEIEERRLQMQEEMLKLQRESILLLQNVVQKLDRVEENQKETKAT